MGTGSKSRRPDSRKNGGEKKKAKAKKKKLSTVPNKKATNMYLILPSYAKSIKQRSKCYCKRKKPIMHNYIFQKYL